MSWYVFSECLSLLISRVVHPGDTYNVSSESPGMRPWVASLCFGNCLQDVFSGCLGVCRGVSSECPCSVLDVECVLELALTYPQDVFLGRRNMCPWGARGCGFWFSIVCRFFASTQKRYTIKNQKPRP